MKKTIEDIQTISDKCDGYRRDVLDSVCLFDTAFRLGGEDCDISFKIRKLGYRIVQNNNCAVEHIFNQSHREDNIVNHFRKAFKSTEDAVYVLQRYGMWYKFDCLIAVLLPFIGLPYLLAKNFVKSLRYWRRYHKLDLIIPIWIFCFAWDILAGFGWIYGIISTIFKR
jgi:GT2 family glycosyltransferase